MKKSIWMRLLLSAVMVFSVVIPTAVLEENETNEAPYILRTEADGKYVNDRVNVWLELSKINSENISSYQISLQLTDEDGQHLNDCKMDLEFDQALNNTKVKSAVFDESTGIMKIIVAGTKNLVEIEDDYHKLPIGKITVSHDEGVELHQFKIVTAGATGDLITVGTDHKKIVASEKYGENFQVICDGTIFGQPILYPLTVEANNGTVKVIVDDEVVTDLNEIEKGKTVKITQSANSGYKFTGIKAVNLETDEEITVDGNFIFNMTAPIKLTVTFEKDEEQYTVITKNDQNDESETKEYINRAVATVTAKTIANMQFSHWVNESGDIISYKQNYSFIVVGNITLTAVYVPNETEIEQEATISMDPICTIQPVNGKYRLSFNGKFFLPEGYTLIEYGMLFTPEEDPVIDNFYIGTTAMATAKMLGSSKNNESQFVINVNNVKAGAARSGRMYVIYKDKNGSEKTIYSANVSKSGILPAY